MATARSERWEAEIIRTPALRFVVEHLAMWARVRVREFDATPAAHRDDPSDTDRRFAPAYRSLGALGKCLPHDALPPHGAAACSTALSCSAPRRRRDRLQAFD